MEAPKSTISGKVSEVAIVRTSSSKLFDVGGAKRGVVLDHVLTLVQDIDLLRVLLPEMQPKALCILAKTPFGKGVTEEYKFGFDSEGHGFERFPEAA